MAGQSTNIILPKKLKFFLRKKALAETEKTGKRITMASLIIEAVTKQYKYKEEK